MLRQRVVPSLSRCTICGASFEPFLSLGRQPVANGFLTPAHFGSEKFYELSVGYCGSCHMVQLTSFLPPKEMFHDQYPFFTSSSTRMTAHFGEFAAAVAQRLKTRNDPFVVEIGSNDGTMLLNFKTRGMRHLGIEPSGNVARVARSRGVTTLERFFGLDLAREIRAEHGPADAVVTANVLCHIPALHDVFEGVAHLLASDGLFVFEDPYLADILANTAYDQIYDEHAFFPAVSSIAPLCARHGLEIIDVSPQPVHGGSMRYTIAHRGRYTASPAVQRTIASEAQIGLTRRETYLAFARRVEESRGALVKELGRLKAAGKVVAGYGATAKSTTVTNYCGIGPHLVEYISDTTPLKQGKFSPGMHIPVLPHDAFERDPPDVALLFAWNHSIEILEKEKEFMANGGKFLVYVPRVQYAAGTLRGGETTPFAPERS